MSKLPRLLPLVGVAIGGVIAVNALSGAHALPQLLSATRAAAEEALHPKSGKSGGKSTAPAVSPDPAAKPQSSLPPPMATPAPGAPIVPMCAPSIADLAKAADMSSSEMQILTSLQTRRGQIDEREKDLDTEIQLLAAAETKLDAKLKSMNTLKADIQALMGQADVKTQAEVDRLTTVYSKMKAQDAANVMAQLDDKVRLPIAAAMKPAILSAILDKMGTLEAKDLTEKLAHRFAPVQALAQAAAAPAAPPAAPAPKVPPVAKGKPPQAAANADPAADEAAAAPDATAKAPVKKAPPKKRIAKAAPKKPPPKKPTAEAKADASALPAKPQPYTAAAPAPVATPTKG